VGGECVWRDLCKKPIRRRSAHEFLGRIEPRSIPADTLVSKERSIHGNSRTSASPRVTSASAAIRSRSTPGNSQRSPHVRRTSSRSTTDHTDDTDKDRSEDLSGLIALNQQQARRAPKCHIPRPKLAWGGGPRGRGGLTVHNKRRSQLSSEPGSGEHAPSITQLAELTPAGSIDSHQLAPYPLPTATISSRTSPINPPGSAGERPGRASGGES
jgi:hypothetical protein